MKTIYTNTLSSKPKSYELLKIETKINVLERELSTMSEEFKKYETNDESLFKNTIWMKLQKMNVCCLKLVEAYREYTDLVKN